MIRARIALLIGMFLLAPDAARPAPPAPPAGKQAVSADGWPETSVGALARRWTEAFSKGEKAMRETLPKILTAESLESRDLDSRMESYRSMHERLGALMLSKVDSSGVGELKVTLIASDYQSHRFIFTTHAGPPVRITRVQMIEFRAGGHGYGNGH